jgi:hypothetical protein
MSASNCRRFCDLSHRRSTLDWLDRMVLGAQRPGNLSIVSGDRKQSEPLDYLLG